MAPTSTAITHNGIEFRRYPDSGRRSDRVYYRPSANHIRLGVGYLHQEIWKQAHGPIPAGHHVHHLDEDPLNNDLDNLAVIDGRKHLSEHGLARAARGELGPLPPHALAKAAEWHRSPEGLAWHSEHGKNTWLSRETISATCEQCDTTYESFRPVRFCSNACRSAARRASGVDNVALVCPVCGVGFTVNRYAVHPERCCSRTCAQRHRSRA